jgi:DNA-directed RNA polymerase specialized sigma24 family protein
MGDYDAVVLIADLRKAVEMAELTGRQSDALRWVYEEDLTQAEAGRRMGMTRQGVEQHVNNAIDAIADVYWYWARHDEGYTVTVTTTKGETE